MFTSVRSDKQSDVSLAGKEADLGDPRIGDKFKRIVPNWKTGC
jgi:hypothetical protein